MKNTTNKLLKELSYDCFYGNMDKYEEVRGCMDTFIFYIESRFIDANITELMQENESLKEEILDLKIKISDIKEIIK